jgi:hypothetical protein
MTHDVRDALIAIMREGLIRIRASAARGDINQCVVEADHLHNIPIILLSGRVELLKYYWNVERTLYIEQTDPIGIGEFEPMWSTLLAWLVAQNV